MRPKHIEEVPFRFISKRSNAMRFFHYDRTSYNPDWESWNECFKKISRVFEIVKVYTERIVKEDRLEGKDVGNVHIPRS